MGLSEAGDSEPHPLHPTGPSPVPLHDHSHEVQPRARNRAVCVTLGQGEEGAVSGHPATPACVHHR